MNEFEVVTVIEGPAEEVFAVVQDVTKAPLWELELLDVRRTGKWPLGAGATMICVGTFLARRHESPAVCTGFAGNKQRAAAATREPFYLEVGQVVEPAGTGATLTFHDRGESRGLVKLAGPLVVRLAKRQVHTAAGNLKAVLEQDAL